MSFLTVGGKNSLLLTDHRFCRFSTDLPLFSKSELNQLSIKNPITAILLMSKKLNEYISGEVGVSVRTMPKVSWKTRVRKTLPFPIIIVQLKMETTIDQESGQFTFGKRAEISIAQLKPIIMDQEESLAASSHSIVEETIEKQQVKRSFQGLSRTVLVIYMLLPFFRGLPEGNIRTCTAFLIQIPVPVYNWVQVTFAIVLVFMRHYSELLSAKTSTLKHNKLAVTKFLISLVCILAATLTSALTPKTPLGLVLRVPLLVCCSATFAQMVQVYFNVLYHNIKYFVLMWMSIGIFWTAGGTLFAAYEFDGNFFREFSDAIWNLLVLQSTANFPDVGLPYVGKHMANIIFFVVFLFCNTIIIANVIIANSYNVYKQSTESYELTEGLPKVLLQVLRKKEKKLLELQALRRMSAAGLALREVVNSPFYRLNQWVLNVALFLVVCYHPLGLFPDGILLIMLVLTAMLSFSTLVLVLTMPIKLVLRRPFLLYDLLVVLSTIVVDIFILAEDDRFNYIYPYFALLRVPHIIKPLFQYLFKDELASFQYINPQAKGTIEVQYKLTPRIIRVFATLFLMMLMFSGIGIILYEGLITEDSRGALDAAGLNPDYVFINFNSTLNSFITLFVLLIVNNWNMVVASFVVVSGTRLTRLFFIIYYMLGVLVAYTIVVTCIIECMVSLAERKNAQIMGQQSRKSHSANIRDRLVRAVRQSLVSQNMQGRVNDEYLESCIDQQLSHIQAVQQEV